MSKVYEESRAAFGQLIELFLSADEEDEDEAEIKAMEDRIDKDWKSYLIRTKKYLLELQSLNQNNREFTNALGRDFSPFFTAEPMTQFISSVTNPGLYGVYVHLGVDLVQASRDFVLQELESARVKVAEGLVDGEPWYEFLIRDELTDTKQEL